jgi:hypothetical protein
MFGEGQSDAFCGLKLFGVWYFVVGFYGRISLSFTDLLG